MNKSQQEPLYPVAQMDIDQRIWSIFSQAPSLAKPNREWVYVPQGCNGKSKIQESILAINSGGVLILCNIGSNRV